MAGQPRRRARKLAAAAAAMQAPTALIPEAVGQAPEPTAPTRTRARLPPAPAARVPMPGPATRDAIDQRQASSVRSLQDYIRPGVTLRLERTRPTWCFGWVADYPISEGETLGMFREMVREEHGGQTYRVFVLGAGDVVLFEGKLDVAQPPKERGRIINRAKWEGFEEQQPASSSKSSGELEGVGGVMRLFFDVQKEMNTATLDSVKQLVNGTREQTTELVKQIVGVRGDESARQSFSEQLGQFVEATRGIEKVKKQLFGAAAQQQQGGVDDDDVTLEKEAKRFFLQNVMGSLIQKKNGAAAPRQQPRQPRVSIPDSQPGGQMPPKN